ncbi:MAG: stress response translation initiation inhibitor YciH [Rhizobacter sp.]|jgi:translation initiation factor 1
MSLVYSTDAGRMCPGCRQPADRCTCKAAAPAPVFADGAVRLSRETKGRNGKAVTVVRGLGLGEAELLQWAKAAKAACGTGGTARDGVVEIQGDHGVRLTELLQAQGRKVKRVGG